MLFRGSVTSEESIEIPHFVRNDIMFDYCICAQNIFFTGETLLVQNSETKLGDSGSTCGGAAEFWERFSA